MYEVMEQGLHDMHNRNLIFLAYFMHLRLSFYAALLLISLVLSFYPLDLQSHLSISNITVDKRQAGSQIP